ncbi:hypothetical protein JCM9534A_13200 [Catenuloplanes indicus JCM 9534]
MQLTVPSEVRDLAIPESVGVAAFRIVQESLSNVVRHAPGADTRVRVAATARELTVEVVNDRARRARSACRARLWYPSRSRYGPASGRVVRRRSHTRYPGRATPPPSRARCGGGAPRSRGSAPGDARCPDAGRAVPGAENPVRRCR